MKLSYNPVYMKYLLSILLFACVGVNAQVKPKVVTECTVDFTVGLGEGASAENLQQATMVLYIKGQQSRLDFISPTYTQIKYFNAKDNSAVVLQDLGATKLRRNLDSTKWKRLNEKYEGLTVGYSDESKTILGYQCKKATITLKDGSTYSLFYAPGIIPSTREYEFQFRTIPGFVLEYETMADGANQKVKYTATKINLTPIQPSKFEVPQSGYRVL
jgi:GLPGLI family protein